jgi:hypothetical protein
MVTKEDYLQRLGEIDLERASLLKQVDFFHNRLAELDKEYAALKDLLSISRTDGRWVSQSTPLLEGVYYILKEARKPLHYKEVYRRLQNELFHIGGIASLSNLVVRLNRDRRFMRVKRGVYGLSEWVASDTNPLTEEYTEYRTSALNMEESDKVPTIAEEREIAKTRFILDSIAVDVQVTQTSLKALRDQLLGRDSGFRMPESIDPMAAIPALERKLMNLLEQRDRLTSRLQALERTTPPLESSSASSGLLADPKSTKGGGS